MANLQEDRERERRGVTRAGMGTDLHIVTLGDWQLVCWANPYSHERGQIFRVGQHGQKFCSLL